MSATKIVTRLYTDAPLEAGGEVPLGPDRAHQLRSVLRLQPGAAIALFNARDGEWSATVESLGKTAATARVQAQRRPPAPEPDLWLLFAPLKSGRIDWLAEKATELGVSRLCPVLTRRTTMDRVNLGRLAANAREAAEQCERLSLPAVDEPVPLPRLLDAWAAERLILLADEAGAAPPLPAALAGSADRPLAVLVGPEGGFDAGERELLRSRPFVQPVTLGPRILRAETAAAAALSVVQALRGDWAVPPRGQAVTCGQS